MGNTDERKSEQRRADDLMDRRLPIDLLTRSIGLGHMALSVRSATSVRTYYFSFRRALLPARCLRHSPFSIPRSRYFTQLPSLPLRRLYVGHIPWQVIAPVVLLGTGGLAMIVWYFGSNEFLDAGFPPRAAEAFRIAALGADDWQLQHSIRYWQHGIEIAIADGMDPLDDRILAIKARLMDAIRKQGDIAAEHGLLTGIRDQAMAELKSGKATERAKIVTIVVQANLNLANVFSAC